MLSAVKTRFPGVHAALLLITLLTTSRTALAAAPPPRYWMPLQGVGPEWRDGMLQPLVEGTLDEAEYANGIKVDLNDFGNLVPNGNGRLYVSLTENAGFTGAKCLKPDGTGCEGGTLFLGFQVHAGTTVLGNESGTVVIYLDAARQKTLDNQSCKDANSFPTHRPASEDRKITIDYSSPVRQSRPTLVIHEYKGNCQGWVEITPPGSDPLFEAWAFKASALESSGFLHFEISLPAQPRGLPIFSSQIANEKLFGLGVFHSSRAAGGASFGQFPSIFNKPPTDLETWSWATMDLAEPKRLDLAMTAYNVGQLQITDDGGQGEAKDFARLTFRNDVICMVEQMNGSEREEVVELINDLRANEGLDPMIPVYPQNGEAPNNMILTSGTIMDSDAVLYGDLPEVSTYCADEFDMSPFNGGECLGDGAGYKGIVWARIGIKKSAPDPKSGKPQTWFSDQFVDVFCTHTQADYLGDGEFAHTQFCFDTIGSAAVGVNCIQTANAPDDNPWQVNVREEQWLALRNWAHKKRAGGNGTPNGLDRPAFVLGDLNQIGPKAVSFDHPNEDVEDWIGDTSAQNGFGTEYAAMRTGLGNLSLSKFDKANGWAWDLYDLLARDPKGTWIGQGVESGIPATSANDCITVGQFAGYNTITELPKEARLDYILVLPAEGSFPFYSLTGPTGHTAEPEIDISANAGDWQDGLGCASDHAQVSVRVGLVQTSVTANYNPNKAHRVTYRVNHLFDFNHADTSETDWFVQPGQFELERLSSANAVLDFHSLGFPAIQENEGIQASPKWSDSLVANSGEKIRAGCWISDDDDPSADDTYDGSSFGPGFLGPHFEFDSAYPGTFRLIGNFSTGVGKLLGTADASTADPDGSCVLGCLGVKTRGDGEGVAPDEDVKVTQEIRLEEIN